MLKKYACHVLSLLFIIGSSHRVMAININDLKDEQIQINKDKNKIESQITQTNEQISSFKEDIRKFDIRLNEITDIYNGIMDDIATTEASIKRIELDLLIARNELNTHIETFKKRIKHMYMNNNASYLENILSAKSFSELLNRIIFMNNVIDYDKDLLNKLNETNDYINEKLIEVKQQKADLEVLKLKEKTKLNELEARIKEKEDLIQTLQNNEQLYEEQLDDLLKSSNEIESLIKQEQARIEKERLALEASKSSQSQVDNTNVYSSYAGGMLLWPVPGRSSISSGYGTRISPISGKSEFHTGIDIPAPTGSNIVAAESGVIISAGNQNGYGLTVVISHSNSLSTLYAHNSRLVVQTGQRVNRGDIIAKAGSTGYSTGPHSHFEVRVSGAHTNPINYLK